MIRLMSHYPHPTIDLLRKNDPHHLVGGGHFIKRVHTLLLLQHLWVQAPPVGMRLLLLLAFMPDGIGGKP
jgi:hypothetical protein